MALSSKQVLNLSIKDLERMGQKELRQAVSTLRSTSRKRYERMEEKEMWSPAMRGISSKSPNENAVFPSIRGMDVTTLRNEFKRYRGFLNAPTSTVKGTKQYEKTQKDIISDVVGEDMSEDEVTEFWEIYEEMKESDVGGVLDYKQVMNVVGDVYEERRNPNNRKKRTKRAIKQEVKKRLNKIYEDEQLPAKVYTSKHFDVPTD